jgi:hypothetical protein
VSGRGWSLVSSPDPRDVLDLESEPDRRAKLLVSRQSRINAPHSLLKGRPARQVRPGIMLYGSPASPFAEDYSRCQLSSALCAGCVAVGSNCFARPIDETLLEVDRPKGREVVRRARRQSSLETGLRCEPNRRPAIYLRS